jgi:phosphoglycolate phosphatase-like HAD superfamily hydrolase
MNTPSQSLVVLFDLDGTLVAGPPGQAGAGVFAMNAASIEVAGKPASFSGADYAGRTDPQIARMLLEDAGFSTPSRAAVDALIASYLKHLSLRAATHPFRALGDPLRAVESLRAQGWRVGLGTGNVRPGADIKLKSAGLDGLFSMEFGGFGDDGESRAEMLECGARSMDPTRSLKVVVVGDTPRDVEAALKIGAYCIGVPFGKNSQDVLVAAGAHAAVDEVGPHLKDVIRTLF